MDDFSMKLNNLLVETFRTILKVEEQIIKSSDDIDLSISEMHLIESVGKVSENEKTISDIAEDLDITLPSVTTAINKLVHRGFVEKEKGQRDGRKVFVKLTKKGEQIDKLHKYFHEKMVRSVTKELTEDEKSAMLHGIEKLNTFFSKSNLSIRRNK